MIEAVNQTREPFQEVENGLERLRKTRLDASRVVLEEGRAQSYLSQVYRYQYMAYYDHLSVMRSVGSLGNQLIGIVNQRNLAELRLGDALRDVSEAQTLVNTALDLYGEDSINYQAAWDNLTEAQARYKKAASDEGWGKLAVVQSMIGMLGITGQVILKIYELQKLYGTFSGIGAAVAAAEVAAGAVLGTTAGAAGASLVAGAGLVGLMTAPDILAYRAGQTVESPFNEFLPAGAEPAYQKKGEEGLTVQESLANWRNTITTAVLENISYDTAEQKRTTGTAGANIATTSKTTVVVNIGTVTKEQDVDAVVRAVAKATQATDRLMR